MASSTVQETRQVPVRVSVPPGTPPDARVFLAGSLPVAGNWRADGCELTRAADGIYIGAFALEAGAPLEYKFTRGTWDSVEQNADGGDRANRTLPGGDTAPSITAAVDRWAGGAGRTDTVVGTLRILQAPSEGLAVARTIRVWLPPGYDPRAAVTYPVLYLQDGQNCFDRATSAYGSEWQVDETLTRLVAARAVPPMIAVGIDNAGADRIREYTFVADPRDGGGGGAAYADWVLRGLLPFVARSFHAESGPANTFIGGSSLGALVSLEIARRSPGVFGGVLAMSPALWWDDQITADELERDASGLARTRVWLDIGTREVVSLPEAGPPDTQNQRAVDEARRLDAALTRAGIEHSFTVDDGAPHNEAAWAHRFPAALSYLVGGL